MCLMRGKHFLRHSSTLQVPISLSSAEAEYYALTRGGAYALGAQSHFEDWGIVGTTVELVPRLHSDSSSARSFASRKGLGKQRHVQTRYLWLQDRVRVGHLALRRIAGTENASDMLTKALPAAEFLKCCEKLGLHSRDPWQRAVCCFSMRSARFQRGDREMYVLEIHGEAARGVQADRVRIVFFA